MAGVLGDKCRDNIDTASETFAEHGNFIRAVIRSQVKNEAEADDIFQDFFLSLVCTPVPDGVKNVKSYLYKAIINDVVDTVRRVETYRAIMHKYRQQLNYSVNGTCPENALTTKEEIDRVFVLIKGRLRSSQSRAISLRYVNGLDIKEVAEKMKVNSRSVSRYVSVGLRKIRRLLIPKAK